MKICTYDHAGSRVKKTAPTTTALYVSPSYELEQTALGTTKRNYINDGNELVATIEETPTVAMPLPPDTITNTAHRRF